MVSEEQQKIIYDENSIDVLEGLEAVRKRPAMYIGNGGRFAILKEALDNAIDEATAGYSKMVKCVVQDDLTFFVCDEGRGIPVGIHPKFEKQKISTLEIILTKLHAGGKLRKGAYSGGSIGCFTGDTRLKLLDGTYPTFEELWNRWNKTQEKFWVYSKNVDKQKNEFQINKCYGVYRTKQVEDLVEVTFDNGKKVKCTLDHPFMNYDGSFTEAKDLKEGQSLAGLHWAYDKCGKTVANIMNHTVTKIRFLKCEPTWVYGMSVENDHNYLLEAGVFVKNTHGVGISCTNALSKHFQCWTFRDGNWYTETFEYGKPTSKVVKIPSTKLPFKQQKGTIVKFVCDETILKSPLNKSEIKDYLENCSFLNSGIQFVYEETETNTVNVFKSNGLLDFITKITTKYGEQKFENLGKPFSFKNETVDVCLQWFESDDTNLTSWVNSSKTVEGGTHVDGLVKVITNCFGKLAKKKNYKPEDLRVGLYGGLNYRVAEPQFDSQTKEKLINPDATKIVYEAIEKEFDKYLNSNKAFTKRIIDRANEMRSIYNKFVSEKKALSKVKTKGKASLPPPTKFVISNCKDDNLRELFICEGESAGGTAKAARNPYYQEILKLKGKILNTAKANLSKVYESEDILNILKAIGFDPVNRNHNIRVGKVIILTDADVDGVHISTLLLTLFKFYYPELLEQGRVFCVDAPLFIGKTRTKTLYGADLQDLQKQSGNEKLLSVTRLKGWGEASANLLKTLAFDPSTRNLIQIQDVTSKQDLDLFKKLVGEDTEIRKQLLFQK